MTSRVTISSPPSPFTTSSMASSLTGLGVSHSSLSDPLFLFRTWERIDTHLIVFIFMLLIRHLISSHMFHDCFLSSFLSYAAPTSTIPSVSPSFIRNLVPLLHPNFLFPLLFFMFMILIPFMIIIHQTSPSQPTTNSSLKGPLLVDRYFLTTCCLTILSIPHCFIFFFLDLVISLAYFGLLFHIHF